MKYGGLLLYLVAFGCASAESGNGKDQDLSGVAAFDLATPPSGPFDLAVPDLAPPLDFMAPLKVPGDTCTQDSDCASGLCRAPVPGLGSICVIPCIAQNDCAGLVNWFCEAITPGDKNGLCIPHSPMHCASCNSDADCGILAERCFQAPGDTMPACHIDC